MPSSMFHEDSTTARGSAAQDGLMNNHWMTSNGSRPSTPVSRPVVSHPILVPTTPPHSVSSPRTRNTSPTSTSSRGRWGASHMPSPITSPGSIATNLDSPQLKHVERRQVAIAIPNLITLTTPTPRRASFDLGNGPFQKGDEMELDEIHHTRPQTPSPHDHSKQPTEETTHVSSLPASPFHDSRAWVTPPPEETRKIKRSFEKHIPRMGWPSSDGTGRPVSMGIRQHSQERMMQPRRLFQDNPEPGFWKSYRASMQLDPALGGKYTSDRASYGMPLAGYQDDSKKAELLEALELDSESEDGHHQCLPVSEKRKLPRNSQTIWSASEPVQQEVKIPADSASLQHAPRPSTRLLFSLSTRRDLLCVCLPATLLAACAAAMPPIMTLLIGKMFGTFANYPLVPSQATNDQKHQFMSEISRYCLYLTLAGVGVWLLNAAMLGLWTRMGELVAHRLRRRVYEAVMSKPMGWFDTGMGLTGTSTRGSHGQNGANGGDEGGAIGAGGLMAKVTKETDDVRLATGAIFGQTIESLFTSLACIILAFVYSWSLALVILSAIPLVVILTSFAETRIRPNTMLERKATAQASTTVETKTSAIATVKAFNAQSQESQRFTEQVSEISRRHVLQSNWWGIVLGSTHLLLSIMFVAGFWYGSKLVQAGKSTPEVVMTVFWACLLGSSTLQKTVAQLVILTNGKIGMASMLGVIGPITSKGRPTSLMAKIKPPRAFGEIDLRHVSFAYPSRSGTLALDDITLFLPAGETTFIVGGSGSGKSTVAHLLLRLYDPTSGQLLFDNQEMRFLDHDFLREHVFAVQQGCVLFDMTVHDNVAMGLAGSPHRQPSDASREEVVAACKMANIHDFIVGLPEGYDTRLGAKAASLSGGQKQRLAIARARLRDPTVLILDEATAALDTTSRLQVFDEIKKWRRNRTTICITHDLSQIGSDDFVYVMKDGRLVEQGFRADLIHRSDSHLGRMASIQAVQPRPLEDRNGWNDIERDAEEILEVVDDRSTSSCTALHRLSVASARPLSASYLAYLDYANLGRAESRMSATRTNSAALPGRTGIRPLSGHLQGRRKTMGLAAAETDYRRSRVLSTYFDDDNSTGGDHDDDLPDSIAHLGLSTVYRSYFGITPMKWLLAFGAFLAIVQGVSTPLWSKYVAKLMGLISPHAKDDLSSVASIVIGITVIAGFTTGASYMVLQVVGAAFARTLRTNAFDIILFQEQSWFDRPENSSGRLMQLLLKDADEIKNLMSSIISRVLTVIVMLSMALIWAFVVDWHLTLVGLALGPVFGIVTAIQGRLSARVEAKNKLARDELSKSFYEAVANVRNIRALAFDDVFRSAFEADLRKARETGNLSALISGVGMGASLSLTYFAQALMIFVSAALVERAILNYATMLQVYSLILFSVTFAAVPQIARAQIAAGDFLRLLFLKRNGTEQQGELRFPIHGQIEFERVSFAYPTRSAMSVLRRFDLRIGAGECVCLVGPSGCGKTTVASLIQRLYEPQVGSIRVDGYKLAQADVRWLRDHTAVVSQFPYLFDATVSENIAYGNVAVPQHEIERAAKSANIHEFILSLPQGYQTHLGENASLISGGQAQRLQIARALLRRASILILDECTSALDTDNQKAIIDTIIRVKDKRTTIFITHKAEVMKRCDRVICLAEGQVAEQGSYDELIRKGGVFAKLMQSGDVQ